MAILGHHDSVGIHRGEPADHRCKPPENVCGCLHKAIRLHEVPCAARVHDHRCAGKCRAEIAHGTAVVKMDMREDQPCEVIGPEPGICQFAANDVHGRLGPAVD